MSNIKFVVVRGLELHIKLTRHAQERIDLREVCPDLLFDAIEAAFGEILDDSRIYSGKYPNFVVYHKDFRISCACELTIEGINVITVSLGVLEPRYREQKVFEVDARDNVVIKKGADYL